MHPCYNRIPENTCTLGQQLEKVKTPNKFTRSQKKDFDWKENCFICGETCSFKHRSNWSRVEGSINENSKLIAKRLDVRKNT